MCCFSRSVQSVSRTRIFARPTKGNLQGLAYQMRLQSQDDVAMILPLPVAPGTGDNAVRFIDLELYPSFFDDLAGGFPEAHAAIASKGAPRRPTAAPLQVVAVGSFEASFVPTVKDFDRLDARFRLPAAAWDALPSYASYGFAVFKLKKDAHTFHPMAFEFPRADPGRIFLPTVHIHDGQVHETAYFDHTVYWQLGDQAPSEEGLLSTKNPAPQWRESAGLAGSFVNASKAKGLIAADGHCYQQKLVGNLPNQDTWI